MTFLLYYLIWLEAMHELMSNERHQFQGVLLQAGLSVEVLSQRGTEPFAAVAQHDSIHIHQITEM